MRTLVFLLLLLCSFHTLAETLVFQTFYNNNVEKFGTAGNRIERKRIIKGTILGINEVKLYSIYLNSNFTIQDPDNDAYTIVQADGLEVPLSGADVELLGSFDIRYYTGNHTFTLSLYSDFIQTPFLKRGVSGLYQYKTTSSLSIFKIKAAYLHQQMPLDFYADDKFVLHQRASFIYGRSISIEWEQVISKSIRSSLLLAVRDRKNERPVHYGSEIKLATAINDQNFIHWNIAYYSEDPSKEILSERGYFTYERAGVEYVFEPFFEYLISISYNYTKETEDNPLFGSITQIGTDSYGLSGSFMLEWGELFFSSIYSMTNIDEQFINVSLGVKWDL